MAAPNSRAARSSIYCDSSGVGLQDHLRPTLITIVEVLVGVRRLGQRQLVRDDDGRVRLAVVDQVAKLPVVGLHVRLAGADLHSLEPELTEVERDLPLLGERVV